MSDRNTALRGTSLMRGGGYNVGQEHSSEGYIPNGVGVTMLDRNTALRGTFPAGTISRTKRSFLQCQMLSKQNE